LGIFRHRAFWFSAHLRPVSTGPAYREPTFGRPGRFRFSIDCVRNSIPNFALPTASPPKAGADPVLNDRPFELGKDTRHAEWRLAGRGGCVDAPQAADLLAMAET
jgi:hypothetical protein